MYNICSVLYLAYALPMYREGRPVGTKRREEKDRADPLKSRKPEIPQTGPGKLHSIHLLYRIFKKAEQTRDSSDEVR